MSPVIYGGASGTHGQAQGAKAVDASLGALLKNPSFSPLRQGLTEQFKLSFNSLSSPGCPRTCSGPPALASQILTYRCVPPCLAKNLF